MFTGSIADQMASGNLRRLRQERRASLEVGLMTDGILDIIEGDRGFEAFLSAAITSYSIPFCVRTPWQFVQQLLSLMLCCWGIASLLFDLLGPGPEGIYIEDGPSEVE